MTKNPAKSRAKAVIWDMDGVIADTGTYHFRAWQKVFGEKGVEITFEDFKHNFGQRNDTIVKNTLGDRVSRTEMQSIIREKEKTFRKLARHNLKPLPGVIELIRALGEHGFKVAIGSSAPIENIRFVTRSLGIANSFQAIASGREVTEGKPSPQGFLLAAQKLGVELENCAVIEDSIAGVTAAKRAGMRCLAVTNTHSRESLQEADLVVDTLEKVTPYDLAELLNTNR